MPIYGVMLEAKYEMPADTRDEAIRLAVERAQCLDWNVRAAEILFPPPVPPEAPMQVLRWLAGYQVGVSSRAMALAAIGVPAGHSHPSDMPDLERCLLMLEQCPAVRVGFPRVALLSAEWGRLIREWDGLATAYRDENRLGRATMPVTRNTLARILEGP